MVSPDLSLPSEGHPATPTLLLVDDRAENLVALQAILKDSGYRLLMATSGEEALRLALREPITLALLDVVMPEMDGYEVANHLKQLPRTADVPIIFLTALASDERHIYRAYEVGAVDYMIKPLDPEVVRRKVAVFVELVEQRERIRRQAEALREADRRDFEVRLAQFRLAGDRRYRKLVEGIDHAVGWTTDAELTFTFVSRQAPRILGYPAEQLIQPGFWFSHVHIDDRDALLQMFHQALAEGADLACNHRMQAADGRTLWLHTGVSGEPPGPHGPAELHGISVDVTDIKRAQEEAQRASHVREELLAIVAHDLRNPLGAIRNSAGLLERLAELSGDPRLQTSAGIILRSAARMDRLIGDLLDFALIQAERLVIEHNEVSAADVVQDTVDMFLPIARDKGLRLDAAVAADVPVYGDRDRLMQVLSNLVGNALQFTQQGAIEISVERGPGETVFAVHDTGLGMSRQELSAMWDRFWQAKRKPGAGVGLGLSIARGIVEAHGGKLWADSVVGEGTTFYFTVPSGPRPGAEEASEMAAPH